MTRLTDAEMAEGLRLEAQYQNAKKAWHAEPVPSGEVSYTPARAQVDMAVANMGAWISPGYLASALRELAERRAARCEHCKHWSPVRDGAEGLCEKLALSNGKVNAPTKAFAFSGDNLNSCVATRPDFGCVQFERAEKGEAEA